MKQNYPDGYIFPAIIEKYGNAWSVGFPDLPGCVATGSDFQDALKNAKEAAAFHLWGMEQDGDDIPAASAPDAQELEKGQTVCFLDIPMFPIRAAMDNRSVRKTLTIPWYLNELGEKKHINFSRVLQKALRQELNIG